MLAAAAFLAVAVAFVRVRRHALRLSAERVLHPARAEAGSPARADLTLMNLGNRSTPVLSAVDSFDSQAYDSLLVAKSSLEGAKASFLAGRLPKTAKGPINAAIDAYNAAQATWHLYHDLKDASQHDKLDSDIKALTKAVAEIFKDQPVSPTGKVQ